MRFQQTLALLSVLILGFQQPSGEVEATVTTVVRVQSPCVQSTLWSPNPVLAQNLCLQCFCVNAALSMSLCKVIPPKLYAGLPCLIAPPLTTTTIAPTTTTLATTTLPPTIPTTTTIRPIIIPFPFPQFPPPSVHPGIHFPQPGIPPDILHLLGHEYNPQLHLQGGVGFIAPPGR